LPVQRVNTVTQQLSMGSKAEFYTKTYPGQGTVGYWTVRIPCGCVLSGRSATSTEAFTLAEAKATAHVHG
jgi:hypothetical protein